MELHDHTKPGQKNKFVVTEDETYFVPCIPGKVVPSFVDILAEIFDLGNPEVVETLDRKWDNGKLILDYLEADGGLNIHVPLEQNEYVNKRLQVVLEVKLRIEK